MRQISSRPLLYLVCVLLGFVTYSKRASGEPASNAFEKKLDFPSPVQWKVVPIEVSLISVAWGPANSPEMISRSREDVHARQPEFYPDRPYVLGLKFRAKLPDALSRISAAASGLGLVKDVNGEIDPPMELTQSGFVPFSGSPGVFDIRFDRTSTTDYWDLFPVSASQKEFLFQVISPGSNFGGPGTPKLAFKIIRKDDDFIIVNSTPVVEASCRMFNDRNFEGTMSADLSVKWRLTRHDSVISGTEQYKRVGTTLWLGGSADSLGNFEVEERYPKDVVTGIFKGHFSQGCRMMSGFFSKPDGSKLQPFEFHESGGSNSAADDKQDSEQR